MIDGFSMRIVIATKGLSAERTYGGHWSWVLQYLLGLRDLGHDVCLLDFTAPTEDPALDATAPQMFFRRLAAVGAADLAVLLIGRGWESNDESLETSRSVGRSRSQVAELIRSADCLWNLCGCLSGPLRDAFDYRVMIDVDPGVMQISALEFDLGFQHHHAFFTTGIKLGDADCPVPGLGYRWRGFLPFVHLPSWPEQPPPSPRAPYTTVTGWWGSELPWEGQPISGAKRESFLGCAQVPRRTGCSITLATIFPARGDRNDERDLLGDGWDIVDPLTVARTPARYRRFVARSRGEFSCCKPIYRELRTGWFSDRSVAYLASGRPVVCEDTGFTDHLPAGSGLLAFDHLEGAVDAFRRVEGDYAHHARAARRLAEEHFDSRRQLSAMISQL